VWVCHFVPGRRLPWLAISRSVRTVYEVRGRFTKLWGLEDERVVVSNAQPLLARRRRRRHCAKPGRETSSRGRFLDQAPLWGTVPREMATTNRGVPSFTRQPAREAGPFASERRSSSPDGSRAAGAVDREWEVTLVGRGPSSSGETSLFVREPSLGVWPLNAVASAMCVRVARGGDDLARDRYLPRLRTQLGRRR
jgi:hypothetical protein